MKHQQYRQDNSPSACRATLVLHQSSKQDIINFAGRTTVILSGLCGTTVRFVYRNTVRQISTPAIVCFLCMPMCQYVDIAHKADSESSMPHSFQAELYICCETPHASRHACVANLLPTIALCVQLTTLALQGCTKYGLH